MTVTWSGQPSRAARDIHAHGPRPARVCTVESGLPLLFLLLLPLLVVGCGGTPEGPPVAEIGMLRVELARADLPPDPEADPDDMANRLRRVVERAESIEQFGLAAEASTRLGRWYEERDQLDRAQAHYEDALRFDKLEHYRLRTKLNPLPNVSGIAVSLVNISLVLEKQGDLVNAVSYAERAFRINRNLALSARIKFDAERLARLHENLGRHDAATRYQEIARGVTLRTELERPPTGDVPTDLPPMPDSGLDVDTGNRDGDGGTPPGDGTADNSGRAPPGPNPFGDPDDDDE